MPAKRSAIGHALRIRPENSRNLHEWTSIRAVNTAAFGRSDEADLVDRLRSDGYVLISLVAELKGGIVGHIMFSRMSIHTPRESVPAAALAPVAVHPERQRQGVGSLLIECGLDLLRRRGEAIVIVVGHPDYYSRFGFSAHKSRFLESTFPPEVFMTLELVTGALDGISGPVDYPPPFGI